VKWVMSQMHLAGPGIRLPLVPLASQYETELRQALVLAGVEAGSTQ
jgi:4-hydroxy-tetrahydrodipicolinate synthase